jgi:uncharacterized protein (TIGR00375 family)
VAVVYGDLHIHLGRTSGRKPVKITASPKLTLANIQVVAKFQKGLDLIGLVDAACSGVMADLKELIAKGELVLLSGGGYVWQGLTVFLGSEVELAQSETGREAHFLAFFPSMDALESYAQQLRLWVTNPSLSTQRLRLTPDAWLELVVANSGVALAAHAFTPHKGVYGNCVRKLGEMFTKPQAILGLELGLSANTELAFSIKDTHVYSYIANSDAHSLQTIGREFTVYDLPRLDFTEWSKAMQLKADGIVATHGLEPLLGKYYRSFCPNCNWLAKDEQAIFICPHCAEPMIYGVWDRIRAIADWSGLVNHRPPYRAHVPLPMLPGIGPKTYVQMIHGLGTEIDILYNVSLESIGRLVGPSIAKYVAAVRDGTLLIEPGGGGKYGRVAKNLER